jgi:hypothetical protein
LEVVAGIVGARHFDVTGWTSFEKLT